MSHNALCPQWLINYDYALSKILLYWQFICMLPFLMAQLIYKNVLGQRRLRLCLLQEIPMTTRKTKFKLPKSQSTKCYNGPGSHQSIQLWQQITHLTLIAPAHHHTVFSLATLLPQMHVAISSFRPLQPRFFRPCSREHVSNLRF